VRRTRVRVERFPSFREEIRLRTFCSALGRLVAERRTSLAGAHARVEAVAVWVFLDPETRRPKAVDEVSALYAEAAAGRHARGRLRHDGPDPGGPRASGHFRADHVNNAAYWLVLEERLAATGEPAAIDAEIEYRTAAQPGDAIVVGDGSALWVTSPDGEVHASIRTR
jgi:acyl-ACP thioesterase